MSSMIRFFVPQNPQGKQSPRAVRIGGLTRLAKNPKTAAYEGMVAVLAKQAMEGRPPWDEAVGVRLAIWMPVPQSWSQKKRQAALTHQIVPGVKPDCSNVLKAIEDGCNGIAFRDDALVAQVTISKRFSDTPGVAVTVYPLAKHYEAMAA